MEFYFNVYTDIAYLFDLYFDSYYFFKSIFYELL